MTAPAVAPAPGGVDVLIPCYNYSRYLDACVHSVLDGAGRPVRVLIIDDTSTDGTPQVAAALAAAHANVFYVRHDTNIGHIATYNEGIRWADSAYFILLSADDLLAPGALDRGAAVLDANPHVGLVYGRTHTFTGDAPISPPAAGAPARIVDGIDFIRSVFDDSHNPIASPASVIVRTALQKDVGGYLPELPHAGDLEMYLRFAARAAIGVLDVEQGLYRKHASNMSRGFQDLRDCAQRLAVFETICLNERACLPDHALLLQRVRRTMATELVWNASRVFEDGAAAATHIDEQLAFAAEIDPSIQRARCWQGLRVKRMVGRAWTRRAALLLDAIRAV